MLDLIDFKKEFLKCCRNELYAAGASDFDIEERKVNKPQYGELNGLLFKRPEDNCAPTLYVEDFYEMYRKGWSVAGLSHDAVETVMNSLQCAEALVREDLDFSSDTGRLRARLINKTRNREYLRDVPYRDAGCGFVFIADVESGEFRAVITRGLLEESGLDKDDLFDKAIINTAANYPAVMYDLSEAVCNEPGEGENLLDGPAPSNRPPEGAMFVLSNSRMFWGAGALFYPGVMEKIKAVMKDDYYILPSSVHELIIVAAEGNDPKKLAEIVRSANRSVVSDAEILADDLFMYCSGKLIRVSYGGIIPPRGALLC